jgi:hypothetical protein
MQAPGSLVGTVTAVGGEPLAGVSVTVDGMTPSTTGVDGSYTVTGVAPGTRVVKFAKLGYVTQTITPVVIADGATASLNAVMLVAPGSLVGTVTATGGTPLSGVSVTAESGATTTTTADGGYTVAMSPGTYAVTYSKSGYVSQVYSVTIGAGGTTRNDVVLAVAPTTGSLVGTVTAVGGGVLQGVSVKVGASSPATTGAGGGYTVSGIAPGTYTITYSKSGYVSQEFSMAFYAGATTRNDVVLAPA